MGLPSPGMRVGAKVRLIDLLNREVFIGMRRIFGQHQGGSGPMVREISPQAIVIAGPENSADGIRATFRQILHGAAPARTIVVGKREMPFVTGTEPDWPPVLHTDRGHGLRRLEIPRVAYLWALAEREGWVDEVPLVPATGPGWAPMPMDTTSEHPHDRYLVALNREARASEARVQREVPNDPLSLAVTDIDPYRIVAEFAPTSDFMSCWNMDPAKELARELSLVGSASWIRLHVLDRAFTGWITIEERFRPRPEDITPQPPRNAPPDARRQEFWRLRQACEGIGWERGELARVVPIPR